MPALVSLFRGVNVVGNNRVKMEELRAMYEALEFRGAQTFIQSGNVVCSVRDKDLSAVCKRIENAFEKQFGFRRDLIVRTTRELREVVAKNPFAKRKGIDGSKLLITFLAEDPGATVREALHILKTDGEEVHSIGRELYVYFPDGMGRSKAAVAISKILKNKGTARNMNTVQKLLAMAEELESKK